MRAPSAASSPKTGAWSPASIWFAAGAAAGGVLAMARILPEAALCVYRARASGTRADPGAACRRLDRGVGHCLDRGAEAEIRRRVAARGDRLEQALDLDHLEIVEAERVTRRRAERGVVGMLGAGEDGAVAAAAPGHMGSCVGREQKQLVEPLLVE